MPGTKRAAFALTVAVLVGAGATASAQTTVADAEATEQQPLTLAVLGEQQNPADAPPRAVEAQAQTPVPAGTGLDRLSDDWPSWLDVGLQYRGRAEGSKDLATLGGRDDSYYLNRVRIDTAVNATPWLRGFVQLQDSQTLGFDVDTEPTIHTNTFDLRQGYVETSPSGAAYGVRVGRQLLNYGDQRLIGALDWTNTSRTYDAVRGWWSKSGLRIEGFAAAVVRVEQDRFDRRKDGEALYGAVVTANNVIPNGMVEPFVFIKQSDTLTGELGSSGSGTLYTMGARAVGALPNRFSYDLQGAAQRGDHASDSISAFAGHANLGYLIQDSSVKPKVFVEYNHASGDDDSTDGRRTTFDQLYPTNHFKYGTADFQGWKNMRSITAGFTASPVRKVAMNVAYHRFFLDTLNDALYTAGGGAFVTNPLASSRSVASEMDVYSTWTVSKELTVQGGLSGLFSGDYLKESRDGGTVWKPYLMWITNF
jgi:hypothetical protein